ncbi:MAG: hypothetical protein IKG23_08510 [Clostridia bacterium]|nr:hypothetical protein [Clostridia bacterium]
MEISGVVAAAKNTPDAANYAEALVLDVAENAGTDDYTLVWSTDYTGLYPPMKD